MQMFVMNSLYSTTIVALWIYALSQEFFEFCNILLIDASPQDLIRQV